MDTITRRRYALFIFFLIPGIGMSSWVTRTPAIRDLLEASTAEMGLVLFGLSVGSMAGILASGPLVTRFGARAIIGVGATSLILSMPTIGMGAMLGLPLLVAVGLGLFGAGMGSAEVAMNVEGADVEQATGRIFLPALHGCFSLGTVIGASLGIWATAAEFPVVIHLLIVGALATVALIRALPWLPSGTGRVDRTTVSTGTPTLGSMWRDSRLVLIGLIVLAMALTEGTANDWLPLVMVDGHGFDPAWGSATFAVFAAAMTIGRFCGGYFVERFGRDKVLAVSAASAAIGLGLVSFVDSQAVAAAAVVLWGLGASLGFPVAVSAAGDSGPAPTARVALVSTLGYVAFLVGPPLLGFVGEAVGLRGALVIPMVIAALAILLAPATRPCLEVAVHSE